MKKQLGLILICGALVGAEEAPRPPVVQVEHCLVSLIDSVQVPAKEPGVLASLAVREGDTVAVGQQLGQIEDTQARLGKDAAIAQRKVTQQKADNDVNVRYAKAAKDVAANEHKFNEAANKKVAGTKSAVEIEKLELAVKQAGLQIEQAQHEQQLARFETDANSAKVSMAEDDIDRRRIVAPLSGVVAQLLFRPGEWVQPGNPVLRIVRLDRLRVEGFVSAAEFSPREVSGRLVRVEIPFARGRVERFAGQIVFIDPLVQAGGEYRVWAEVDNLRDGGHWLLRPGMEGRMTIELETAADAPASKAVAKTQQGQ